MCIVVVFQFLSHTIKTIRYPIFPVLVILASDLSLQLLVEYSKLCISYQAI